MSNSFNRPKRRPSKKATPALAATPEVQFTGDEQLTQVRFWDDGNPAQQIFSGLVPLQYKTDRTRGMEWVALRDRALADREAAVASAEQSRLEAEASAPPALDPLEVAAAASAVAESADARLQEMEATIAQLVLATPEQVLTAGLQINRVANGVEEVNAALDQGLATIASTGVEAQSALAEIQSQATTSTDQVNTFVQAASAALDQTKAEMVASTKQSISRRVAGLEAQAAALRGPTGRTGAPGSGLGIINGNPNQASPEQFQQRYGRNLVPADVALQQSDDGLRIWSYTGEAWDQVGFIPTVVRVESRPLSIYDASTKVQSTTTNITNKGGSGSSSPLSVSSRTLSGTAGGALVRAASADSLGEPLEKEGVFCKGADLILHLQAMDGPNVGDSYFAHHMVSDDSAGGATDSFTTYAELGNGAIGIEVEMSQGQGRPPSKPGQGSSTTVSATHTPILSIRVAQNGTGATQFLVSGDVRWAMPSAANGEPLKPTW